jgi:hypothetical protein
MQCFQNYRPEGPSFYFTEAVTLKIYTKRHVSIAKRTFFTKRMHGLLRAWPPNDRRFVMFKKKNLVETI